MKSPDHLVPQPLAASLSKALERMEEVGNALLEHFGSLSGVQTSNATLVLQDLASRTVLVQDLLRQPLDDPDMADLARAMLADTQSLLQQFA